MKTIFVILSFVILAACSSGRMDVTDEGKLIIRKDGKEVLTYNYLTTYPPAGVDTFYKKSGYIHPVLTPSGKVLTTIQPSDHIHHYGIWNPWTRIEFGNKTYDLWNLQAHEGTVRAGEIKELFDQKEYAGFTIRQDHVLFTEEGEKQILEEDLTILAWDVPGGYLWDMISRFTLAPDIRSDVALKQYRYGGLVFRATPEWTAATCRIFSSDKESRNEIDGTTARWICVNGEIEGEKAGILIMSHPDNYNAPQPLRIWDETMNNGTGEVMINFSPVKFEDWVLQPGKTYELKYRFFSYDGELDAVQAEDLWNEYI